MTKRDIDIANLPIYRLVNGFCVSTAGGSYSDTIYAAQRRAQKTHICTARFSVFAQFTRGHTYTHPCTLHAWYVVRGEPFSLRDETSLCVLLRLLLIHIRTGAWRSQFWVINFYCQLLNICEWIIDRNGFGSGNKSERLISHNSSFGDALKLCPNDYRNRLWLLPLFSLSLSLVIPHCVRRNKQQTKPKAKKYNNISKNGEIYILSTNNSTTTIASKKRVLLKRPRTGSSLLCACVV